MTDSIVSEHAGGVALLTVDAPGSRNALTLELSAQLAAAVAAAERDESVHAVVVTGCVTLTNSAQLIPISPSPFPTPPRVRWLSRPVRSMCCPAVRSKISTFLA